MNSKKLIRSLWKKFPIKIARKYHDYVGLMCGSLKEDTSKILLCLDVSKAAVKYAIENSVDLIISHHPFIYGKKKIVLLDPLKNSLYQQLLENNIPVYSFHTNFDEGKDGMNDALAEALLLNNIRPIPNLEMARMGELSTPLEVNEFAKYAIDKLKIEYGQLLNYGTSTIKTVGILGGAGARDYEIAIKEGCDIFISGDTPYHIRREIIDKGLNYLHLDHEIEKIFITQMKKILLNLNQNLEIIEFDDVVQAKIIL